jgi:hypothetical protein
MSTQEASSLLDRASHWQARSLRVTAFPSPSAKIGEPKWWRELLGTDAETRNQRPSRGELTEQGPFDTGLLTLNIMPVRLDWTLSSKPDLESDDGGIPTLGGFQETGDKFMKLMAEWLGLATTAPLQRIAFGAILDQPVRDTEEGYKLLARYLPSVQLSTDSTDFFYQINRPRELKSSQTEKLSVNRLSKWSCVSLRRGLFQYSLDGTQNTSVLGETTYACSVELDISTSADFKGELPQQALVQILREQYDLGKEIAAKGDIA